MSEKKRFRELLAEIGPPEDGRAYAVRYAAVPPGMVAHVVVDDQIFELADYIEALPEEARLGSLDSVRESLRGYVEGSLKRPPSPRVTQNAADDVGIWWVYEVLAGRGREHIVLGYDKSRSTDMTRLSRQFHRSTKAERRARRGR